MMDINKTLAMNKIDIQSINKFKGIWIHIKLWTLILTLYFWWLSPSPFVKFKITFTLITINSTQHGYFLLIRNFYFSRDILSFISVEEHVPEVNVVTFEDLSVNYLLGSNAEGKKCSVEYAGGEAIWRAHILLIVS